jgi:hypothetical protein
MVKAAVGESHYSARLEEHHQQLAALAQRANVELPIFAMSPGTRVGSPVALHFFEPRYKILSTHACRTTTAPVML